MSGCLGRGRGGEEEVAVGGFGVKSGVAEIPLVRKKVKIKVDLNELTNSITGTKKINVVSATRVNCERRSFSEGPTTTGRHTVTNRVGGTHRVSKSKVVKCGVVITLGRCTSRMGTTMGTNTSVVVSNTKLPARLPRLMGKDLAGVTPVMSARGSTGMVLGC